MAIRVSPGSGATVATEIISGANYQQIKVVDGTPGNSTPWIINSDGSGLFSTNNLMSLASGTVILASQNGTWNVGVTGLISLASGTNIQATQSGQWDIRSALSLASIYGSVGVVGTVPVSGTFWQATQPISGNVGITGLVSLASGTQITTATNNLTSLASGTQIIANQGGNWDIRSALSLASIYGTVGITGTPTVNINGLISLASGTTVLASFGGVVSLASGQLIQVGNNGNTFDIRSVLSLASIYGSVGISGTPTVNVNGLISLASGTSVLTAFSGLISLASGTNILATQNGSWDIRSALSLASIYGKVSTVGTVTVDGSGVTQPISGNVGITGLVSLASGTSVLTAFSGLISLASGTNILATQSGSWDIRSALSLASIYGSVGIVGTPTVSVSGLISLASGTSVLTAFSGLISLASGTQIITSTTNLTSLASGTNILATQSGNWDIRSALSLASIYGIVGNAAGANYIGLASIVPGFTPVSANYTSFATLITASGAASLFAPPNNQRWILKDLIIGSAGNNVVNIQSGGSIVLIPYMSLATMGGFISNFGESGMRADALNSAFVINTKSTATLSIFANVRFDSV